MSHSDVEKLVRERSYELSRKLFQAHVDSRGPGEAAAPVRGADGVERDQERIHERGLTTIFGEIRVKRACADSAKRELGRRILRALDFVRLAYVNYTGVVYHFNP